MFSHDRQQRLHRTPFTFARQENYYLRTKIPSTDAPILIRHDPPLRAEETTKHAKCSAPFTRGKKWRIHNRPAAPWKSKLGPPSYRLKSDRAEGDRNRGY
uniref:Uncharacterized protein n=1 Tax=Anopheles atroparvus TaxID=41427 RepID=A0AAG5CXV2_ANOAO